MFFPSLPDRAANAFRIIFDIHKFLELNIVAVVNKIEDAQGFTIFICGYTIFYLNPFKDLNFFPPYTLMLILCIRCQFLITKQKIDKIK